MKDREMLELAARAAGLTLDYRHGSDAYYYDDPETGREEWKPNHDNGQALRLAVNQRIELGFATLDGKHEFVTARHPEDDGEVWELIDDRGEMVAACRAITRAAAEIGKSMEGADG